MPELLYPKDVVERLRRQGYHLVGRHSAVKKCFWLHKSLVEGRPCYKERFYGISSHRCLQMSPSLLHCLTDCVYCWRVLPEEVGARLKPPREWDEPELVVEGCLREQRRILSGYKSQAIQGRVDWRRFEEAMNPNQAAISLSGEPCLYPHLPGLIEEFSRRGFTTFLVTSGVMPYSLRRLLELSREPSQLYISLTASDIEEYKRVNRPLSEKLWHSLMKSLELLGSFSCPTVVRITVISGLNDDAESVRRFAGLVCRFEPTYVEAKAYMHLGFSTTRLPRSCMPSFEDVERFSAYLAELTGYRVADSSEDSRVFLLTRLQRPVRFGG